MTEKKILERINGKEPEPEWEIFVFGLIVGILLTIIIYI
jgi:hypothetical protein